MAKKATKKVVAKPAKKPMKSKVSAPKKAVAAKKATTKVTKKDEVSKKVSPSTSAKVKGGASKKDVKAVGKVAKVVEKKIKGEAVAPSGAKEKPTRSKQAKGRDAETTDFELSMTDVGEALESAGGSAKKGKKYEGATEEESKWLELKDKNRNIKPLPYKMSEVYQEKTPIEHKVLGWGFILSVVNDRLEVLFRSGIKHLISNYKTNS